MAVPPASFNAAQFAVLQGLMSALDVEKGLGQRPKFRVEKNIRNGGDLNVLRVSFKRGPEIDDICINMPSGYRKTITDTQLIPRSLEAPRGGSPVFLAASVWRGISFSLRVEGAGTKGLCSH